MVLVEALLLVTRWQLAEVLQGLLIGQCILHRKICGVARVGERARVVGPSQVPLQVPTSIRHALLLSRSPHVSNSCLAGCATTVSAISSLAPL